MQTAVRRPLSTTEKCVVYNFQLIECNVVVFLSRFVVSCRFNLCNVLKLYGNNFLLLFFSTSIEHFESITNSRLPFIRLASKRDK